MLQQPIRKTFDIGDGREITIETGRLARQADGSVTVSMGKCMILATVVANKEPKEGQSFFPLTVDYQEKICFSGSYSRLVFKRGIKTERLRSANQPPDWPALWDPCFDDYFLRGTGAGYINQQWSEVLPDALACLAALWQL